MARFTPHTEEDIREMLEAVGVKTLDDLFDDVVPEFEGELNLPPIQSEYEAHVSAEILGGKNTAGLSVFLGGGAYDRIIPSAVGAIISRGEFMTPYTPYQPEVSQGVLQASFEFQSTISELTGMDLASGSVYDGASAVAEAALMSARQTGRAAVVAVSSGLNPRYQEVIESYPVETVELPFDGGTTDFSEAPEDISGIIVQTPNYFGVVEDVAAAVEAAHRIEALAIAVCDPISLAVLKPPGDFGVDVVVGETQPLGIPISFGGPYAGYMATRGELVRQLPGHVTGETVDMDGETTYVFTLRAREQDIRRARANSNICTNQALASLAATVYASLLGPQGLREVAESSIFKAHYLAERMQDAGFELRYPGVPFLWEFVVKLPDVSQTNEVLMEAGIVGGLDLGDGAMLVAVTEKRSKKEMDTFVEVVEGAN